MGNPSGASHSSDEIAEHQGETTTNEDRTKLEDQQVAAEDRANSALHDWARRTATASASATTKSSKEAT